MQGMGQLRLMTADQRFSRPYLRWVKAPMQCLFAGLWASRQCDLRFVAEPATGNRNGRVEPDPFSAVLTPLAANGRGS
jgi:hypothetical protein